MDQAAGDVKSREPQNPHYEQNDTDKQKHVVPPEAIFIQAFYLVPASRIRAHLGPLHRNQFLKKFAEGNLRRLVLRGNNGCPP